MNATRAHLLTTLAQTQSILEKLSQPLSESALDFRPGPNEWSVREILAHLVDDEMFVMRTRLERIIKEDHPTLVPNDEKQWHRNRNTSRDTLAELLGDLSLQRAATLGILFFLRDADWKRSGYHPERGDITTETLVESWVAHDITHIEQIEQNIALYNRK